MLLVEFKSENRIAVFDIARLSVADWFEYKFSIAETITLSDSPFIANATLYRLEAWIKQFFCMGYMLTGSGEETTLATAPFDDVVKGFEELAEIGATLIAQSQIPRVRENLKFAFGLMRGADKVDKSGLEILTEQGKLPTACECKQCRGEQDGSDTDCIFETSFARQLANLNLEDIPRFWDLPMYVFRAHLIDQEAQYIAAQKSAADQAALAERERIDGRYS